MGAYSNSAYSAEEEPCDTVDRQSPTLERHERTLKALSMLSRAVDELITKLGDVLLPETPQPMSDDNMGSKTPDLGPVSSRLGDQHSQIMAVLLAQTYKLENLTNRVDL